MPSWGWAGAVLIVAFAVFGCWLLVQRTKRPRKFFRGGFADPLRDELPPEERTTLAPQTVKEPTRRSFLETTIDEEAAALVEGDGERHHTPPLTTNLDREAAALIDEQVGDSSEGTGARPRESVPPGDADPTRPLSSKPRGPVGDPQARESAPAPAEEPASGIPLPRPRRRIRWRRGRV
ncbi:hypothetical protein ACQEU5_00870 [Marinactinospora thermotolerans]|uniref:Uncharacterized protein n=1 Tax=Marinactinospora thermotolerans DSM 45154 TaxID=1122192 RepID=A0A1T4KXL4_9ACTN|nr:hypothetical protein [Marinactinospora thermotolerans]SJZ47184.1 hypothetical protein SAMN02745673_00594 [Marinactinospora thermotolerans DSM 45154]